MELVNKNATGWDNWVSFGDEGIFGVLFYNIYDTITLTEDLQRSQTRAKKYPKRNTYKMYHMGNYKLIWQRECAIQNRNKHTEVKKELYEKILTLAKTIQAINSCLGRIIYLIPNL